MATTAQQLLDDVTAYAAHSTAGPTPTIEDAVGALAHAGRGLHRLAIDGLDTHVSSPRERMLDQLAAACDVTAGLWPPTGGPLTDLMGAAADIAGRARPLMGRAERWGLAVEFAATADHCAQLARRLVPRAAVAELGQVHQLAAAVERTAQANPPQPAGATLDRLVPVSHLPPGLTGSQVAAEASAALVTAIDCAGDRGGLTLRELRAVVAAAELSSRYLAAVAAALPGGDDGQPWRSAAVAWQVAGHAAAVFEDGHRINRPAHSDVVAWASRIPDALSHELGPATGIDPPTLNGRPDLPRLLNDLQQVANQTPLIADQLTSVTRRWAAEGQLHAYATDLPHMDDMPEDRVRQVVAGHRVMAFGVDLAPEVRLT